MTGTHVALLRGINVGTAKRVSMAELRALVEGLGFTDVRTLLNSGNVVFGCTAKNARDAAVRIEKALASSMGISSRVTVLAAKDIAAAVAGNPLQAVTDNPSRLLVHFFARPADLARPKPLAAQSWKPDVLALGTKVAYAWCAAGVLDSPLARAAAKALGDTVTTRNWSTLLKLNALLEDEV